MIFETGAVYCGFRLLEVHDVKEIASRGLLFEHVKSGARLVKLENADDNKFFAIAFRTPPRDSSGLPHILEHSVLCGSRKFPSKEPFVELMKGSLRTFLNAFTFPDKTMYPVASRNTKDFFNLMNVYLDAVFHPNLHSRPEILMQEGWHYELDGPGDDIIYKGVVYNEMRGAYSNPDAVLGRKVRQTLFPDTAYGVDSGGDPDVIPELTQESFSAFHRKYYHPSNSFIFLHGDGDTLAELAFIGGEYLEGFEARTVDSGIGMQPAFIEPVERTIQYPVSKDESAEGKTYLSLNWATSISRDTVQCLGMEILEHLLLETPAAPLKKALLESGIGKDVYGSYNGDILQTTFRVVVKHSDQDKKEEFLRIVLETLTGLMESGIDRKLVEASINATEFRLREADSQGAPEGLDLAMKSLSSWLHGGSPFAPLEYEAALSFLRKVMHQNYFEELIEGFLLRNRHRSLLTVQPVRGLEDERNEALRKKLADYKASLSSEQIAEMVEQTAQLKKLQTEPDSPEAIASIPRLSLDDIGRQAEILPLEELEEDGVKVLLHNLFTRRIAYVDLFFDTSAVPVEDLPYLSLLTAVLSRIDTVGYGYADLSNELNLHTGGIVLDAAVRRHLPTGRMLPCMEVRAKSLVQKLPELMDLLGEVLGHTRFDNRKRLNEIVQEMKSRLERLINSGSHVIARLRMFSYLSKEGQYSERTQGFALYKAIAGMADNFDLEADEILRKLQETAERVFNRRALTIGVTLDEGDYQEFVKLLPAFLGHLSDGPFVPVGYSFEPPMTNEGLMTPGRVQYVAKGYDLSKLGCGYSGAMDVVSTVSRLAYLWNTIRVRGGAYGVFAQFERDGRFYLGSFRDPNLAETLQVFDGLPAFLRDEAFTEEDLTKYVIGTVAALDKPLTPFMKGHRADVRWMTGVSAEDVQRERDQVVSTGLREIREIAGLIQAALDRNCFCVVGSESRIMENRELFNDLIQVFK